MSKLKEYRARVAATDSLFQLCETLRWIAGDVDVDAYDGSEDAYEKIKDDLPTFGGDEPEPEGGIYSWDESSILWCDGEWFISSRSC